MAAISEFSFLLSALIINIHADELIIVRKEGESYTFELPEEANSSCLISTFVGEEKIVLWNTSDLWSENCTLPKDLTRPLSDSSISYYEINNLTHSDSGTYQEECWMKDNVTHRNNISIIICSSIDTERKADVFTGGTVDLPCEGAADNLDFQWLKLEFGYEQETWTRVFGDNSTSVMDNVKGRYQVVTNTSTLRVSDWRRTVYKTYTCLVMNHQQCVSSHPVGFDVWKPEVIYRSVEETAVLPCTLTDFTHDQPPRWCKYKLGCNADLGPQVTVDQNNSLVFSSLMLNHSDHYICSTKGIRILYALFVCPKFDPPAVELFSEGEEITLGCRDRGENNRSMWFIRSNQTDGRIFNTKSDLSMMSRVSLNREDGSLVLSKVSLEDTGEYWCAIGGPDDQCKSVTKVLLKHREPERFGFHSIFYTVRCSVLSGLLVMLCVVVVAVIQRTRRGQQLSAETHSLYEDLHFTSLMAHWLQCSVLNTRL